jgi:hypothetical protein
MMKLIIKGVQFICLGIAEIFLSVLRGILGLIVSVRKRYRRRKLRKATEYVRKYGYELDLNARVKLAGKAYYVFSYEFAEDIEDRREVRLSLIGVPQYKEIKRRIREQ